jgi:hypothetical protein
MHHQHHQRGSLPSCNCIPRRSEIVAYGGKSAINGCICRQTTPSSGEKECRRNCRVTLCACHLAQWSDQHTVRRTTVSVSNTGHPILVWWQSWASPLSSQLFAFPPADDLYLAPPSGDVGCGVQFCERWGLYRQPIPTEMS